MCATAAKVGVGNFRVNPRFRPTVVGWNVGLTWEFPTPTNVMEHAPRKTDKAREPRCIAMASKIIQLLTRTGGDANGDVNTEVTEEQHRRAATYPYQQVHQEVAHTEPKLRPGISLIARPISHHGL